MIQSPRASLSPFMQAAKAPTPGTSSPSAFIAVSKSRVISTSAPDAGEGALGGADVAEAVVEDDDLLGLRRAQFHTSSRRTPATRHIAAPIDEQHDEALRHLLLDEGDRPRRARKRPTTIRMVDEAVGHSAPFVEGRMPAARGSRSEA